MKSMFKGTYLTALDLDQDPQVALKNQMVTFCEADLQKTYACAKVQDKEKVTIESRSRHTGRKLQAWSKTVSPPGLNNAPDDNP